LTPESAIQQEEERLNPFFHRLSKVKQEEILGSHMTIGELLDTYRQPSWCGYPDALAGIMGCWSLIDAGRIRKKADCANCDEMINKIKEEYDTIRGSNSTSGRNEAT